MTRPIGNFGLLQGRHGSPGIHSPNLRGAMPRPLVTSAMVAASRSREAPVVPVSPPTAEEQARNQAAEMIAARRRSFWEAEHPGGNYFSDQEEYTALGRELCEAGLGLGLASQWLAMCCAHYRSMLDGGAFRFLDTHQTILASPGLGFEEYLVCRRCGVSGQRLNREACRGDEIYRERVREDKVKLGSLVELFSELGG